mgnify:CR=1 FL=1
MSDTNFALVDFHLARITEISSGAQEESISRILESAVNEALDSFARVWNPLAQLERFIEQLKFKSKLLEDEAPAIADMLNLAADMASRASTD